MVCGIGCYAALNRFGYPWVAGAMVLNALGMRVVGVVAGTNVMKGLPPERTTTGAALVDTVSEVATAVGIGISGTVLAALFAGSITAGNWSAGQTADFRNAVTCAAAVLTVLAGACAGWGISRLRR